MSRQSKAEAAREAKRFEFLELIVVKGTALYQYTAKYVLCGYCAYKVAETIQAFAGKDTSTDLAMKIIANISVKETISYTVAASGLGYGYWQRHLRKKVTAHVQAQNQALESAVDVKRSSSNITSLGYTNPEDQD